MQYDLLNNLTPFLMKSVEKWGSAGQKTISKWEGRGVMKSVFLQILMISSAIEIIFMF